MAKVNGMAFTQWDGPFIGIKLAFLAKWTSARSTLTPQVEYTHKNDKPYREYQKPCQESREGSKG